ncbi:hypothetical protein RvY_09188 [Ramazzottius varieornatus]|uniref:Uncharacterized protein n=1 Tax=Ramazzottius varieornatus TaxID=947166 RepID=A0A1D1V8I0_RAMVA|nr:hypothetical protein RvY_09188 [Ramazzottius varieornatus]
MTCPWPYQAFMASLVVSRGYPPSIMVHSRRDSLFMSSDGVLVFLQTSPRGSWNSSNSSRIMIAALAGSVSKVTHPSVQPYSSSLRRVLYENCFSFFSVVYNKTRGIWKYSSQDGL